jgi:hypothetical protein
MREADPQQRTINRAMLNEQNELGLIIDRSVEMQKIPDLMRAMLGQMAREFPNQDLIVLAYAPSNPPRGQHVSGATKPGNSGSRDSCFRNCRTSRYGSEHSENRSSSRRCRSDT